MKILQVLIASILLLSFHSLTTYAEESNSLDNYNVDDITESLSSSNINDSIQGTNSHVTKPTYGLKSRRFTRTHKYPKPVERNNDDIINEFDGAIANSADNNQIDSDELLNDNDAAETESEGVDDANGDTILESTYDNKNAQDVANELDDAITNSADNDIENFDEVDNNDAPEVDSAAFNHHYGNYATPYPVPYMHYANHNFYPPQYSQYHYYQPPQHNYYYKPSRWGNFFSSLAGAVAGVGIGDAIFD